MARFTDVFLDETKRGYKIQTSEYLPFGKYPIIDQGQIQIAGYTNLENGLFTDVPAIIFGDHTRIVKYVDTPFFLGADGVKVLKAKVNDADYKYLFYCLQNVKIPNTGYNRHFKWLKEVDIPFPPLDEQRKIAAVLDKVSDLIAKRHQQLDKLDEMVKSRFVEMFGNLGEDKFGWGLQRFGDCCIINPKKNQDLRLTPNLLVSFVPMSSISEKGDIDSSMLRTYDEVKNGFTYFAENDVLFAKITPCMENGKGAIAQNLKNGIGFGSTEFHVMRPINGVSNSYWIYVLSKLHQFREDAEANMTGSAGQRRVPASFLNKYRITLPPIEMQNQFATFVEQTEKTKTIISRSLEKLETLKKALMQEYF